MTILRENVSIFLVRKEEKSTPVNILKDDIPASKKIYK